MKRIHSERDELFEENDGDARETAIELGGLSAMLLLLIGLPILLLPAFMWLLTDRLPQTLRLLLP